MPGCRVGLRFRRRPLAFLSLWANQSCRVAGKAPSYGCLWERGRNVVGQVAQELDSNS